jgi:hypothetical protein
VIVNQAMIFVPGQRSRIPVRVVKVRRSAACDGQPAVRIIAKWKGETLQHDVPARSDWWGALCEAMEWLKGRTGIVDGDYVVGTDGFNVGKSRRRVS